MPATGYGRESGGDEGGFCSLPLIHGVILGRIFTIAINYFEWLLQGLICRNVQCLRVQSVGAVDAQQP